MITMMALNIWKKKTKNAHRFLTSACILNIPINTIYWYNQHSVQ